jgi:hypothetical protein
MYKIIGADQKEYGPISTDQIRQWISEGRVNVETRACAEGSTDWKPLGMFPDFASVSPGSTSSGAPAVEKPPGAIKVFGILNIVFGALALACSPFSLITLPMARRQLGYSSFMVNWMIVSVVIGMIGGAIMLASGIGLCKRQAWARRLAIYYSCAACVLAPSIPSSRSPIFPKAEPILRRKKWAPCSVPFSELSSDWRTTACSSISSADPPSNVRWAKRPQFPLRYNSSPKM